MMCYLFISSLPSPILRYGSLHSEAEVPNRKRIEPQNYAALPLIFKSILDWIIYCLTCALVQKDIQKIINFNILRISFPFLSKLTVEFLQCKVIIIIL